MLLFSGVVSDGGAYEVFQSRLIDGITLVKIYRAGFFRVKARIEEFVCVFQGSALKKVQFYGLLEDTGRTNQSLVRPYRAIPFPFLGNAGVGLVDDFAQAGHQLAAPVGEFRNLLVDTFR